MSATPGPHREQTGYYGYGNPSVASINQQSIPSHLGPGITSLTPTGDHHLEHIVGVVNYIDQRKKAEAELLRKLRESDTARRFQQDITNQVHVNNKRLKEETTELKRKEKERIEAEREGSIDENAAEGNGPKRKRSKTEDAVENEKAVSDMD